MIATITPPIAAIIGILVDGLDAAAAATMIVEGDDEGLTVRVTVLVTVAVADGVKPPVWLGVSVSVRVPD